MSLFGGGCVPCANDPTRCQCPMGAHCLVDPCTFGNEPVTSQGPEQLRGDFNPPPGGTGGGSLNDRIMGRYLTFLLLAGAAWWLVGRGKR